MLQNIAQLEVKLELQDMSGTVLRAAIAQLEAYSSATEGKAEEADSELLALDRELTILKSNVRRSCRCSSMPLQQHVHCNHARCMYYLADFDEFQQSSDSSNAKATYNGIGCF